MLLYDLYPGAEVIKKKYIKKYIFYLISSNLPAFLYKYLLSVFYFGVFSSFPNLTNPKLLTEKIQWLKLNDLSPLKMRLTDKSEAKKYVRDLLPELKVAKVYDIRERFEEIDIQNLPNTFILKTNHACKTHKRVENKETLLADGNLYNGYKRAFNRCLKINYAFFNCFELNYKNIKPKVYAEELLKSKNEYQHPEYFVWCFNGEPCIIQVYLNVSSNEEVRYAFKTFDLNWNETEIFDEPRAPGKHEKPLFFDEMIEYSKILSKDFKFVRVDFMSFDNRLYFGELTFSPSSGFFRFLKSEDNLYFGNILKL